MLFEPTGFSTTRGQPPGATSSISGRSVTVLITIPAGPRGPGRGWSIQQGGMSSWGCCSSGALFISIAAMRFAVASKTAHAGRPAAVEARTASISSRDRRLSGFGGWPPKSGRRWEGESQRIRPPAPPGIQFRTAGETGRQRPPGTAEPCIGSTITCKAKLA